MPNVPMISPLSSRSGSFVVTTHVTDPSLRVSFSSFPTSGRPVAITSRSSRMAAMACSNVNTSKSVLPTRSRVVRPGAYAAAQPALTNRNRLSLSLKYTRSTRAASRLSMQIRFSRSSSPLAPCGVAVTICPPAGCVPAVTTTRQRRTGCAAATGTGSPSWGIAAGRHR